MMKPTVLHFIVCDRVRIDPENLHSINIDGIKWSIRSTQVPPFPLTAPPLRILAVFMGGDGYAEMTIQIVHGDSRRILSKSQKPHRVHFTGDPESVNGMKGVVTDCTFPGPGLYWVELVMFDEIIARQPLLLLQ